MKGLRISQAFFCIHFPAEAPATHYFSTTSLFAHAEQQAVNSLQLAVLVEN
jgi:hypothetical protein